MYGKDVEFRPLLAEYYDRQKIALDEFKKHEKSGDIDLLNIHDYMCGEGFCEVFRDKKSIYIDNSHVSRTYAVKLSPIFDVMFED